LTSSYLPWYKFFNGFGPVFSSVGRLAFAYEKNLRSVFVIHKEVDRTQWHRLLRLFRNVKTLLVEDLVRELSRNQSEDEEFVLDLLPTLEELSYSSGGYQHRWFDGFINARQVAGLPVTLVHR